ncbi:hypothetical protein Tco_0252018 [Tanacetum coccineum]
MNVESLQTKYPIIDWEVYSEDSRMYWKIIRVGNHTEVYQIFEDMRKIFDRDDLVKLWSLVHERFNSTEPTEDKERELWVEMKKLFEPDDDDTIWKLQRYMYDPLKWRLYDTCDVHYVSTERGHDIFMLVEKDYPLTRALMTLMLCNKRKVENIIRMEQYLTHTDYALWEVIMNSDALAIASASTEEDYTDEPDISTANVPVSTAGAEVSTASPEVRTAAESLVYIKRSAAKRKDKGKAIMKEAEPVQKKKKLHLEQEMIGLEEALRLQEQLDEEEWQRIAIVQEEASTFNTEEWDKILAQIKVDEELVRRLQAQEREGYSEADKELFGTTMKRVNSFTPMESDDTFPKVVAGSSKRDAEQELNQESLKRQKIGEGLEPAKESKD